MATLYGGTYSEIYLNPSVLRIIENKNNFSNLARELLLNKECRESQYLLLAEYKNYDMIACILNASILFRISVIEFMGALDIVLKKFNNDDYEAELQAIRPELARLISERELTKAGCLEIYTLLSSSTIKTKLCLLESKVNNEITEFELISQDQPKLEKERANINQSLEELEKERANINQSLEELSFLFSQEELEKERADINQSLEELSFLSSQEELEKERANIDREEVLAEIGRLEKNCQDFIDPLEKNYQDFIELSESLEKYEKQLMQNKQKMQKKQKYKALAPELSNLKDKFTAMEHYAYYREQFASMQHSLICLQASNIPSSSIQEYKKHVKIVIESYKGYNAASNSIFEELSKHIDDFNKYCAPILSNEGNHAMDECMHIAAYKKIIDTCEHKLHYIGLLYSKIFALNNSIKVEEENLEQYKDKLENVLRNKEYSGSIKTLCGLYSEEIILFSQWRTLRYKTDLRALCYIYMNLTEFRPIDLAFISLMDFKEYDYVGKEDPLNSLAKINTKSWQSYLEYMSKKYPELYTENWKKECFALILYADSISKRASPLIGSVDKDEFIKYINKTYNDYGL